MCSIPEFQKSQRLSKQVQISKTSRLQANTHFAKPSPFAIKRLYTMCVLNWKVVHRIEILLGLLLLKHAYENTMLTLPSTNAATIIGATTPIEFPMALTIPATVPA
mgnify:CR=1 FL=1